jgi:quercetin dioxygenase-like cupin family protein
MASTWHKGNAARDGAPGRGWLVGHFINEADDIRATKDVEIKWGTHPAGEERAEWSTDEYRTTVILLVRGRFSLNLSVESVVLEREGDYVMWGPGVDHSWRAEEDSVVVTVRWPSLPS